MRVLGLAIGISAIVVAQAAGADERFARSLQMLAPAERLEQLCGYTAMTRIRQDDKSFRPDRTVANAMTEPRVQNDTIVVKGGAFRSRGKWFALTYNCTATPDRMAVVAFGYTIGPEIPETKWAGFGLWQ
ncbi:MAG TPA: DUF930 domain-containing protein [Pseudolabrys sp.]|nr:DUF930 domain-containing protein [Pseudolabrys sp.]